LSLAAAWALECLDAELFRVEVSQHLIPEVTKLIKQSIGALQEELRDAVRSMDQIQEEMNQRLNTLIRPVISQDIGGENAAADFFGDHGLVHKALITVQEVNPSQPINPQEQRTNTRTEEEQDKRTDARTEEEDSPSYAEIRSKHAIGFRRQEASVLATEDHVDDHIIEDELGRDDEEEEESSPHREIHETLAIGSRRDAASPVATGTPVDDHSIEDARHRDDEKESERSGCVGTRIDPNDL